MNRCETCKYPEPMFRGFLLEDEDPVWFVCGRVVGPSYRDPDDRPLAPNAYVQDGSDYMAELRVKADFGCVLWEAKT